MCSVVHVDLVGMYVKSMFQQHPDVNIILNELYLTFIEISNPATGWFIIVRILCFL